MIPIVVDTNIIFSAIYNKNGLERKIIDIIIASSKVQLFSPPIFWEEIQRTLRNKLDYTITEINDFLSVFSIIKVPPKKFKHKITKASELIDHKSDVPFVAVALYLNAPIWSGNTRHFKPLLNNEEIIWVNSRRLYDYLKTKGIFST